MEDQEKKEVFINPTLKLNPNDYELGFRINGDIDTCACGKEIFGNTTHIQKFIVTADVEKDGKNIYYNYLKQYGT
jgi:Ser-tRNA(Ala) deacylase AlaX